MDQVRIAQSPLDPKRDRAQAVRLALGLLCQDHHLLFSFAALLVLSCLASGAVGVAQWLVDLSTEPQTV
jgi:hypothetical protein